MPDVFASPDIPEGFTNILATSGAGTVFELANQSQSINAIGDGLSNTTLAVRADVDQAVEWTQPQDWLFDPANPTDGLGGLRPEALSREVIRRAGFYTVYADGSVRYIPANIDSSNFTAMVMRDDGDIVDFDEALLERGPEHNLRQLGLAAWNFESTFGILPRHAIYNSNGSQPLLSWRVQLLPFLDQQNLYDQFNLDEAWDSPNNISLLDKMPEVFRSSGIADGMTNILALVGDETAFPTLASIGLGNISDPLQETIMFVQADANEAVEWTRPADITYAPETPRNGIGDATESGFFVATVNGGTAFIHSSISDATVALLAERSDGNLLEESFARVPNDLELYGHSANNLRQVAIAVLNHESSFQRLPAHAIYSPASAEGTPVLSWRVSLLPFLGYQGLYDQFNLDEPWDSPHNLSLLPLMPDVFAHPSVPDGMTLTQVITSPLGSSTTAFPIHFEGASFSSISDGASNTVGVVQANPDQAVEWTKPQDLFFDDTAAGSDSTEGLGEAIFGWGSAVARMDSSVAFVRSCISHEMLRFHVLAADGQIPPDLTCATGAVPPFQLSHGRNVPDDGSGGFSGIVDSNDNGPIGNRFIASLDSTKYDFLLYPATNLSTNSATRDFRLTTAGLATTVRFPAINTGQDNIRSQTITKVEPSVRPIIALKKNIEHEPLLSFEGVETIFDDFDSAFVDADSSFLTNHLSSRIANEKLDQ